MDHSVVAIVQTGTSPMIGSCDGSQSTQLRHYQTLGIPLRPGWICLGCGPSLIVESVVVHSGVLVGL